MDIMEDIMSYASPSSMLNDTGREESKSTQPPNQTTSDRIPPTASDSKTPLNNVNKSKSEPISTPIPTKPKGAPIEEQAAYVPIRLSEEERKLLVVLENALEVCEYTDVVDVTFSYTRKSKQARIIENLIDTLSIACGLMLSNNLTKGEKIVSGKTMNDNVWLFRDMFEIGRRYKIMNPSKMRNTYGKMMYILMDTESYHIKQEINIDFVKPIITVSSFLESKGAKEMLSDPLLYNATVSIENDIVDDKEHHIIQSELMKKQSAVSELIKKYSSQTMSEDDVKRVIDSIADNSAYYSFNVRPVERMLEILVDSFDPSGPSSPEFSLELSMRPKKLFSSFSIYGSGGYSSKYFGGGSCLNHDHKTQYTFVLQSLTLWKEIMTHLPMLWYLADLDMTKESYRLADTGQGYQRLQSCPRVSKVMSSILTRVQNRCGSWVGLSVVHLGDRDVPNALVFIDKYSQVPRILAPIVQCIERLPSLVEDKAFYQYVKDEWDSIKSLRMQILSDFFKHGFDGSGDDGGSCIDGRLTSAWNWCSKLHKKPFYYVFMFTGFQGFDGDFK